MGNSFFMGITLDRKQHQSQVANAAENTMQGSLVHQPADNGFALGASVNYQVIEPAFSNMAFNPDFVNDGTVTMIQG